jgi:transposase
MIKNLANLNQEQMKEYFLGIPLGVKNINVTIKGFGRLLNVLMLLLMSLLQLRKKKNKQLSRKKKKKQLLRKIMTYIILHQIGMM